MDPIGTPDAERVPQHAGVSQDVLHAVAVVIHGAFPKPVAKHDVQAQTGLGSDDLRAALAELEANGDVVPGDAGYTWGTMAPDPDGAAEGDDPNPDYDPDHPGDDPESDPLDDEPGSAPEPAGDAPTGLHDLFSAASPRPADGSAPAGPPGHTRTRYEAVVMLEVAFYAEPRDGESDDAAGAREAVELSDMARAAVAKQFPGLPLTARVVRLDAYDAPRVVFPAG